MKRSCAHGSVTSFGLVSAILRRLFSGKLFFGRFAQLFSFISLATLFFDGRRRTTVTLMF